MAYSSSSNQSVNFTSLYGNFKASSSSTRNTINLAFRTGIIIIGITGNLFLLATAWTDRRLQLGTRMLSINIAFSAFLLMAIGQVGVNVHFYLYLPKACALYAATQLLGTVANWADVALAVNRLVAVCYPHQYSRIASAQFGGLFCGLTWLTGITMVSFMGAGLGSSYREVRPGQCAQGPTSSFGVFLLMMTTFVPVLACGLVVLRIAVTFFANGRVTSGNVNPAGRARSTSRKRQLVRAMMASFVWCSIAILPWTVIYSFYPVAVATSLVLGDVLRLLLTSEYALSPILFLAFYGRRRDGSCRFPCTGSPRRPSDTNGRTSSKVVGPTAGSSIGHGLTCQRNFGPSHVDGQEAPESTRH